MKLTVKMMGGDYFNVDEENYPNGIEDFHQAMRNKTPIYVGERIVQGASIESVAPFGNPHEYGPHLASGFESAQLLLDARKPTKKSAEIRKEIAQTLYDIDPTVVRMRNQQAVKALAVRIHGEEAVKDWRLADWEGFNVLHPEAFEEFKELEPEAAEAMYQRVCEHVKQVRSNR